MPTKKKSKVLKAQKTLKRRKRFLNQYSEIASKNKIRIDYKKIAELDKLSKDKKTSFKKVFYEFAGEKKREKISYIKNKYDVPSDVAKNILETSINKNVNYSKIVSEVESIYKIENEPIDSIKKEIKQTGETETFSRISTFANIDSLLREGSIFKYNENNLIKIEAGSFQWEGSRSDYLLERLQIKNELENEVANLDQFKQYADAWKIENLFDLNLDAFEGDVMELNFGFRSDIDDYIPEWDAKKK